MIVIEPFPMNPRVRSALAFAEQLEAHARVGGNADHSPAELRAHAAAYRRRAERLETEGAQQHG